MKKINKILNTLIIISIIIIPILFFVSIYVSLVGKYYVSVNDANKTEIENMLKENDIETSGELAKIGYQQGLGDWEFYLIYNDLESEEITFDDGDARELYGYTKNYGKNLASYLAVIIEILLKSIFICFILKIFCKIYQKTNSKKVLYIIAIIIIIFIIFSIFNKIREKSEIKELFEESAWVKVHLKLETTQEETDILTKEIEKMPYFKTIDFVPKEEIFAGYGDIDLLKDGIKMECYYITDNNGNFDEFAYFKNIENEFKKYDCVDSVTYGSLLDLYSLGGMRRVNEYREKVKRIEEREKEEKEKDYSSIKESQNITDNKIENNIAYANHYDLTVFSDYYGKNISYKKTVELLNKFCNEYYIYLTNSESKTGNNPGVYVYLSRNNQEDNMRKDAVVDTIKSNLKVFEDSVEATYNISYGMNQKYGEYIFIERNDLKMLRGDFKITSKTDGSKGNYDYIEDFKVILDSQEFIDKVNSNYNIDIINNVKIWSMTKNNFLMNIGCEGINKEQYNEYSDYVFKTFKEFVKNKYNLDIEKTTTFNEVIQ